MVYLWILSGLVIACILLGVANIILKRVLKKRANTSKEKGDKE